MLGDTAQLMVELSLKDNLSSGLSKASSSVSGISSKFGGLKGIVSGVEGAASHAAHQISGLVSNIGLMAGGAGLLSIGAGIEQSITKVEQLGDATFKLQQITGESAQSMSSLIAVSEQWGVSADSVTSVASMYEKTVGKLVETTAKATKAQASAALQTLETRKLDLQAAGDKTTVINKLISEQKAEDALAAAKTSGLASLNKLQALQKQYGVTLTDSKGQAISFTDALSNVSKMFEASTTAAQKATAAALASQVFGRGYKTLLPVLELGPEKYAQAAAEAQALGVTLNDTNMAQLAQLRTVQHTWTDVLGGLEIQAGLTIIPMLTQIGQAANKFLGDPGNRASLLGALKSVEGMAETVAGVIVKVGSAIAGIWGMIPGPMKELLVGGAVLSKTSSWLFGINPVTSIAKTGTGLLGGLLGNILGKVPGVSAVAGAAGLEGTRVYVTNFSDLAAMNILGGGGAAPAAAAAAEDATAAAAVGGAEATGFMATLSPLLAVALPAALALGLAAAADPIQKFLGDAYDPKKHPVPADQLSWPWGPKDTPVLNLGPFKNILGGDSGIPKVPTAPKPEGTPPTRQFGIIADTLRDIGRNNKPLNAASVLPMIGALNSVFKSSTDASGKSVANAVKQETTLMKLAYSQGNKALGDAIKASLHDLNMSISTLDGTLVSLPGAISGSIAGWTGSAQTVQGIANRISEDLGQGGPTKPKPTAPTWVPKSPKLAAAGGVFGLFESATVGERGPERLSTYPGGAVVQPIDGRGGGITVSVHVSSATNPRQNNWSNDIQQRLGRDRVQ